MNSLRQRAFGTPFDAVITLGVFGLLGWMAWVAFDWGVLRATASAEHVSACREKAAGAC